MILVSDAQRIPLADQSVDLVFGSPPYEDARTYGIGCNLSGDDWVEWAANGFMECLRVSKGLVGWVVQGRTQQFKWSATPSLFMAELHRRGVCLRNPPLYVRSGIPGSGGPDWLRSDYEWVVCASRRGRLPWSDNTACGAPPKFGPGGDMTNRDENGKRRLSRGGMRLADGTRRLHGYTIPELANPGNLIKCKGGHLGKKIGHENEAPFPLALAEFFIRSFCPPKGIVLDPFGGSGTTAHAAVKWGRRFVSADIRTSQAELTRRRLADVQMQLEMSA